ncbi:MAG: folylpolyglutamate synthase/dihydrofolate synthase family protein [Candidatus Margulisiibacteriota bacterium]
MKYLDSLEKFGINLGLDRINYLLKELGSPHLKFRSIHVAGTNGKGSTCAMVASILKEAGFKVGLYTSPHLFDYTERIKINGKDISRKDFNRGIERIKRIRRDEHGKVFEPTVFEVLTALAFWYFAEKKVEYAVVEVGMGGRLDATNVLTPLVSVITNVELEHTQVLGKTLARIAREKAGIIKEGVPVVTAERKSVALNVIKRISKINKSKLLSVTPSSLLLTPNLIGPHQQINAACALAAINAAKIKIPQTAITKGLKKVSWPARFQIARRKPLTIVDGAHNPAGIKVLIDTLFRQFPDKKFTFIVGVQEDKDIGNMRKEILRAAKKVFFTHSIHKRAVRKIAGAKMYDLANALSMTDKEDRAICGSFFLAADALKLLDVKVNT